MENFSFYHLHVSNALSFEIAVDDGETDEISLAIRSGSYSSPPAYSLLTALAQPGQHVLDLGAHIGTFSLYAAALGYPVTAVEASPRNAALLAESARRNGFANLRLVNQAVSDRAETLKFIQAGPYGMRANPHLHDPTIEVPANTVPAILDGGTAGPPAFVKLDVEGSEVRALRGMKKLLAGASAPPILYESNGHTLYYFGETPNRLMALLERAGYRCYLVDGECLVPAGADTLQPMCTVDYLALKGPPPAQLSTADAPLTEQELMRRVLACCAVNNAQERAYIGRTLRTAPSAMLAAPEIQAALDTLLLDAAEEVRQAASWWSSPGSRLRRRYWTLRARVLRRLNRR